jgi:hypothetical protein
MRDLNAVGILFYIRQNRSIKRDYGVYCCIKVKEGGSRELCISSSIKKQDWDTRRGRPKQKTEVLIKLALYLDAVKAKLLTIYLDLKLNSEEVSAEKIKNVYLGKEEINMSLLQLMDQAIQQYQKELSPGTLKNYGATRQYVGAFCQMKYKSGDIRLKFLNYAFIDGLKIHILNNPIKPNDPCTNNGCMKHLERIKKMIKWAYEMRLIDRNVFSSFKIRKKRYESKILTWEQLNIIENKEFQRPILNLVLS